LHSVDLLVFGVELILHIIDLPTRRREVDRKKYPAADKAAGYAKNTQQLLLK
jgi:hypothetical protein